MSDKILWEEVTKRYQNRPEDSAILFVGDIDLSFGVIGNKLTQFSEFK